MKIDKAIERIQSLHQRSLQPDKAFLRKTTEYRRCAATVRRYKKTHGRPSVGVQYGIVGVILKGELKGTPASTCKRDPSVPELKGRVAVRVLDGPRRAQVIQIFPRDFSPIQGRKRRPVLVATGVGRPLLRLKKRKAS